MNPYEPLLIEITRIKIEAEKNYEKKGMPNHSYLSGLKRVGKRVYDYWRAYETAFSKEVRTEK